MTDSSFGRYATNYLNPIVGQFLVSGTPWATGSFISGSQEHLIAFPNTAKRLQVQIVGGSPQDSLRLHFLSTSSAGGANIINNQHYWTIHPSASFDANLRTNNVYITVRTQATPVSYIQYAVFAELNSITGSELTALTGSGITD